MYIYIVITRVNKQNWELSSLFLGLSCTAVSRRGVSGNGRKNGSENEEEGEDEIEGDIGRDTPVTFKAVGAVSLSMIGLLPRDTCRMSASIGMCL